MNCFFSLSFNNSSRSSWYYYSVLCNFYFNSSIYKSLSAIINFLSIASSNAFLDNFISFPTIMFYFAIVKARNIALSRNFLKLSYFKLFIISLFTSVILDSTSSRLSFFSNYTSFLSSKICCTWIYNSVSWG